MAHRAEETSTYDFKSSEALLLDANIWLFVYGPEKPTGTRVAAYSEALAKILAAKSWLFDNIILFSAPFFQAVRILSGGVGCLSTHRKDRCRRCAGWGFCIICM